MLGIRPSPFEVPMKICLNLAMLNAFVKALFAHAQ